MQMFDNLSSNKVVTIPAIKYISDAPSDIDALYIICLVLALPIALSYYIYKTFTLNNILGMSFCIFGIENIIFCFIEHL